MVSVAPQKGARSVNLPEARGPVTDRLLESLSAPPHHLTWGADPPEPSDEDDLHLALYCCYELHYQGLADVDAEWEWEPSLLAVRRRLEACFLSDLNGIVGSIADKAGVETAEVVPRLWQMARGADGPSLSQWVATRATLDHVRELAIHRSPYQLKEADPHTLGIPRLHGDAKAAMIAIQGDEYGRGVTALMHATLFADTMRALGLDPAVNLYLDRVPGVTLATTNVMSMFGLHRRWRGALVGHLALFEMTSVEPMARYAGALRRLGVGDAACRFYDTHVHADEIHQHLATDGMVAGLMGQEPELARDVLFGAAALAAVEGRFSQHVLWHWQTGRSSLRHGGPPRVR